MTMELISSKANLFSSLPPSETRPHLASPQTRTFSRPPPSIPHPHSPPCISGFNTNPQRPDCAYNTPWIDKPLISSLSSLSKHPGFEFFFFSPRFSSSCRPLFEVQVSSLRRSQTQSSHLATRPREPKDQTHEAWGWGNRALCVCTLEGGMRLASFFCMFLSTFGTEAVCVFYVRVSGENK